MGIQDLSDAQLLQAIKMKVKKEREALIEVLEHIREVDRRRLYSILKYTSLYHYVTKELGYSEREAYDRINAMRTIREIPSVEQKVGDGRISLAALSQGTSAIRAEVKLARIENVPLPGKERKIQLIEAVEGLSKREAQGTLQKLTGLELEPSETLRAKGDLLEIRMTINPELQKKLEKLKGWLAHSHPNLSTSGLIEKLCDDAIASHEKRLRTTRDSRPRTTLDSKPTLRSGKKPCVSEWPMRISLKAKTKKQVWLNANSKCENCGSNHALEIDHRIPLARNGTNEPENLRLLCRSCNQRAAIENIGLEKMQRFLGQRTD